MKAKTKIWISLLLLALGLPAMETVSAQAPKPTAKTVAQNSTEGTDFWLSFMNVGGFTKETKEFESLVLEVHVSGREAVNVLVEGLGNIAIPAGGGSGFLKIPQGQAYHFASEELNSMGVHVYAQDGQTPFSCVAFMRVGTGANLVHDMTHVIPTAALGLEYLVYTYYEDTQSNEFLVVATEPNTLVKITPACKTTGTVEHDAGEEFQIMMGKGDTYLVASQTQSVAADKKESINLMGSTICSDKPVAVFVGGQAPKMPANASYSAGFNFEQILPLNVFGTDYYLAKTSKNNNFAGIMALYDDTKVNYSMGTTSASVTLAARGDGFLKGTDPTSRELKAGMDNMVIHADKPIVVYNHLSCGGYNMEVVPDPDDPFSTLNYTWGNPANAMIVPWSNRRDTMTFVTKQLEPLKEDDPTHYYLQLVAPWADRNSVRVDNNPVSGWQQFGTDNKMGFVNYKLDDANDYHTVFAKESGFTGTVYAFSQGIGYMYTLGYNPYPNLDSLFVRAEDVTMLSYDLDTIKDESFGDRFYGRQLWEWPIGKERLDTAMVCDGSEVHFESLLGRIATTMSWEIWMLNEKGEHVGKIVRKQNVPAGEDGVTKLDQPLTHKFVLPEEDPAHPSPYINYELGALIDRGRVLCPEMEIDPDTLKMIVRVTRVYDDTIPLYVCTGDTVRFFKDSFPSQDIWDKYRDNQATWPQVLDTKVQERDSTLFIAYKSNVAKPTTGDFECAAVSGHHYYTRRYTSVSGCDSIVTLHLYVCDTVHSPIQTRGLTHENRETGICFPVGYNTMFSGRCITEPGVYFDTLRTTYCHSCVFEEDDKIEFRGCDSIIELHVTLADTIAHSFCDSLYYETTGKKELYPADWFNTEVLENHKDDVYYRHRDINILNADIQKSAVQFAKEGDPQPMYFEYNGKTKSGMDSSIVYAITIVPLETKTYTTTLTPKGGLYSWSIITWDNKVVSTGRKYGPYDKVPDEGKIEDWYLESDVDNKPCEQRLHHLIISFGTRKVEPRTICDNDSIHWRTDVADSKTKYHVIVTSKFLEQYKEEHGVEMPKTEYDTVISVSADPIRPYRRWPSSGYLDDSLKSVVPPYLDSLISLQVYIYPSYPVKTNKTEVQHICNGGEQGPQSFNFTDGIISKVFTGSDYTFSASLTDTIIRDTANYNTHLAHACDSTVALELHVWHFFEQLDTVYLCWDAAANPDEKIFAWKDKYYEQGIAPQQRQNPDYTFSMAELYDVPNGWTVKEQTEQCGCDTIYGMFFYIGKVGHYDTKEQFCGGDVTEYYWDLSDKIPGWKKEDHHYTWEKFTDKVITDTYNNKDGAVWNGKHPDYYTPEACGDNYYLTIEIFNTEGRVQKDTLCTNDDPKAYTNHPGNTPDGKYDPKLLPVGQWYTESQTVTVGDGSCSFEDKLELYIAPAYLPDVPAKTFITDTTVCQTADEMFVWLGHNEPAPHTYLKDRKGTFIYYDSLKTKDDCQCDSVWMLVLHVDSVYDFEQETRTMCDNDTVEWQRHLFVGKNYSGTFDATKFDHVIKGVSFPGLTHDTTYESSSVCKCDSSYHLSLTVYPSYPKAVDTLNVRISSLPGVRYTFYGVNYVGQNYLPTFTTPGYNPPYTFPSILVNNSSDHKTTHDCDSTIARRLIIYPSYMIHLYDTICADTTAGAYYQFENHQYKFTNLREAYDKGKIMDYSKQVDYITAAGEKYYLDPARPNEHVEDSSYVLHLTVLPSYYTYTDVKMSDEDYYVWQDTAYLGPKCTKTITESVKRTEVLHTPDTTIVTKQSTTVPNSELFCDSILTVRIRIGKVYRDTLYDTVCANYPYHWMGVDAHGVEFERKPEQTQIPLTQPGLYLDKYQTVMGFDSIYYLALEHWPIYLTDATDVATRTEQQTICQGDELTWDKHQTSKNHWWLKLPGESKQVTPADIAKLNYGEYVIHDSLETEIHGCDSIWVMNLTITPTYNRTHNKDKVTDERTLCSNDTLHWEDKIIIGKDFDKEAHNIGNQPGYIWLTDDYAKEYEYQVPDGTKTYGCDSTRYLNLTICPMTFEQVFDTIADNEEGWFFGENHRYYKETFHLPSAEDYAVTNRKTRKVLLIDTVKNSCGCDFIRHDSVLIVPSYRFRLPDTIICSNVDCDWYIGNELIQKNVNTLQGTQVLVYNPKTAHYAADSIYERQFTIVPSFEAKESRDLCKNDTLIWHTYMLYYPNDGNDHIQYQAEYATENAICNAVYKLDVDYKPYYHFPVQEDEVCQYDIVDWPGREGHTEHAYRDEQGRPLDAIPSDTTGWITIYDSLHTVECGCDSTYTLRRYVKPGFRDYEYGHVMCSVDSFYWDITGQWYKSKSAGYIRDTVADINIFGCDSIHYLEIAVNQAYLFEDKDEICANQMPYEWPGHNPKTCSLEEALRWTRDTTFVLWDSLETKIAGCDSVYRRELLVHPVLRSYTIDSICAGDTLHHNGHLLTEAGTYVDTIQSVVTGCDSITTLVLKLLPTTRFVVTPPSICANELQYELPFTYTGLDPIGYNVFYDSLGHAHGLEDILEQALSKDDESIIVPLPEQPEGSYLEPNNYHVSVLFDNGVCIDPRPMTISFLLEVRYPAESVLEQHWNDFIGILVPELNGGYNFSSYQWYRNDSLLVGETGPYLYQAHYLVADATYSVALTREGETEAFMTCPLTPDVSRVDTLMPTMPYLSVVPNCVVREHPVVNILSVNEGNYRIFDAVGSLITSGHFTPDEHKAYEITMPATSGIYVVEMSETSGLHRSVKVIVQ